MQGDFFQVLRRVQKEERNKSALARVDNDFYKQLRDYIRHLERSVANDPFGNEQLVLNNAQRIATEICEQRESKITKAANNNIYRSFLLFKKDNPQFDLLDTTPLNLTEEEETLYFSLMDVLKNHRYRISLDEYAEESRIGDEFEEEEDFDEDDDETVFVEDSYDKSSDSEDENPLVDDDLEDEISDALGESDVDAGSSIAESSVGAGSFTAESSGGVADSFTAESDDVLNRLNEIKGAKVITDEKYEHIDAQVANQMYPGGNDLKETQEPQEEVQSEDEEPQEEFQSKGEEPQGKKEESPKSEGFGSSNINDIFKDPDSQFVDLDKLEPNYDDDYYNSISAGSSYAAPSEDDFNMIFAKPKKPKSEEAKPNESKPEESKAEETKFEEPKLETSKSDEIEPTQSDLGFASGLDVKEGAALKEETTGGLNKAIQKSKEESAPKPVDKTRGGLFTRQEVENTTVVISEDIGEMVGIDGKVYGPFLANDVVILPNITAQILISNNKASLMKL